MKNSIYVIYSTSYRLLKENLDKIIKGNNYVTYNQDEVEMNDIIDSASYQSLFSDKNYIVVKNVSSFSSKKKNSEGEENATDDNKLLGYLNEPNPNTVIIFVLKDKMNGVKKVSKLVKEKYNYIEIDKINIKELKESVNTFCKKNKISIDIDGINYIINSLDSNYDLIFNELEKLLLLDEKKFNYDMIVKIISSNVLDNNFKFIDSVVNKDIVSSFKYYDDFLLNKNSPIMIMAMLANEYRNIYLVKTMLNNRNKSEMMSLLNIKYTFQIDKLINNCYSYSLNELENNMMLLCDLDYKIKIGKMSDKNALEWFIIKMCE